MGDRIDIPEARGYLAEFREGLQSLFNQTKSDHEQDALKVCSGYGEFVKEAPAAYLSRASEKLEKKTYKIGVAGVFSAGKSTLVNALLGEPELLPTQAGECTMSITIVTAPKPGEGEMVRAKYFGEEDALKYIFNNTRYKKLLSEFLGDIMTTSGLDLEKAAEAIRKGAEKAGKDPAQSEKKKELTEFLDAVETYRERLGSIWTDDMKNAPMYLTTNELDEGMGHLLLIEQVWLHKDNDLFSKDGFEIIDLPGTDSTNDRQKELTLGYMNEADAVLNVIEPRGIAAAGKEIFETMGQHNNSVKNKMFFIMNMFDKVQMSELGKADIEKVIQHQVFSKLIDFGLDTEKFYLTSAKYQDLQNRKDKGIITNVERKDLEGIMADCNAKLNALDPEINPKIRKLMEECYKDGGVINFKANLMEYLKYDIQIERLREIFTDLGRVYRSTKKLLDSETGKIRELLVNKKSENQEIIEFFDDVKDVFFDKLKPVIQGVEKFIAAQMGRLRENLTKAFGVFIDKYNVQRVVRKMNVRIARDIQLAVFDDIKIKLSDKFAETVRDMLPKMIAGKIRELIDASQVGMVLEKLSEDLGQKWSEEFKTIVNGLEQEMAQFTYMRALEETWHIQDEILQVPATDPQWNDEKEEKFKHDLKTLLVKTFVDYAQKLEEVLGRHYRLLVDRMVDKVEALADEAASFIRKDPDRVTLPIELLTGEEADDEQERINSRLLVYHRDFENVKKVYGKLEQAFDSRN